MIKVEIEADSQEEFDEKRIEIVKALMGNDPLKPRRAVHRFQNEMMDYYDDRFKQHLEHIKKEIKGVLDRHKERL